MFHVKTSSLLTAGCHICTRRIFAPPNCPFHGGIWAPISYVISWAHVSTHTKRHCDLLVCLCWDYATLSLYWLGNVMQICLFPWVSRPHLINIFWAYPRPHPQMTPQSTHSFCRAHTGCSLYFIVDWDRPQNCPFSWRSWLHHPEMEPGSNLLTHHPTKPWVIDLVTRPDLTRSCWL